MFVVKRPSKKLLLLIGGAVLVIITLVSMVAARKRDKRFCANLFVSRILGGRHCASAIVVRARQAAGRSKGRRGRPKG